MFLKGLNVLDVGSYVAGPAAATVMGDFGANVIKVEPPTGDPYRNLLGLVVTEYPNFFWDMDGRNKRSLSIDLTTEKGGEVIVRMIEQADVYITNYRPALLEKLGLTYDRVSEINPGIVYAQINAFGIDGPDANRTGFDTTAWWASSGLMDAVRRPGATPSVSTPGMGDHPTSMALFGGIMGALYRREKTGEGAHVQTSLLASGAWSNSMYLQGALVGYDAVEGRTLDDLKNLPLASPYETRDGRFILLAVLNPDKEWKKFLRALGREDLNDDERFSERVNRMMHGAALYEILVEVFASQDSGYWRRQLDENQITYAFAATLSEVISNEQMYANDILVEMTPGRQLYAHTVNSPIWITGEDKVAPVVAPNIGEHTSEILSEMGLSQEEIGELIDQGAAVQGDGELY